MKEIASECDKDKVMWRSRYENVGRMNARLGDEPLNEAPQGAMDVL